MKKQEDENEEVKKRCGGCGRDDLALKNCAGCGSVAYCNAVCQTADWPKHKTVCKKIKAEKKAQEKANEAARGSGSGLGLADMNMGSLMNALLPPPQPQRYNVVDVYNACVQDHHEKLPAMLRQFGLDLDWAEPQDGQTAAFVSAQLGHVKCLSLLAKHGGADLSKPNNDGFAPIHMTCAQGHYA